MVEIEIHTSKKYAKYLKPHLEAEHPSTRGKIEIENEKPRSKTCFSTIYTGKF